MELAVNKELLDHAHIGVTTTVYAHVRLRLQRDAINLFSHILRNSAGTVVQPDDRDDPPLRNTQSGVSK